MLSPTSGGENNNLSVLHWNYRGFKDFPPELVGDGNSSITDIYLKENHIAEFPRNLNLFRVLKNLYLSGNDIKILPKEISLIRTLKTLDLSGNLLTEIPEEISRLECLKRLILNDNVIEFLPFSLWKLEKLKELSVSDNQLLWLSQRLVSNLYTTKLEYWRNILLQHVPFSIWLHSLIDKEIKYQFAGCFSYPYFYKKYVENKVRVKLRHLVNNITEIVLPFHFFEMQQCEHTSPPSLEELSKRECYSIFKLFESNIDKNNNMDVEQPIDNQHFYNNCLSDSENNSILNSLQLDDILPNFLYEEISKGPTAFCEHCKESLFRYAVVDITTRPIRTVTGSLEVLVSSYFCSGKCCQQWRADYDIAPLQWERA